jgi:hypothetical protein
MAEQVKVLATCCFKSNVRGRTYSSPGRAGKTKTRDLFRQRANEPGGIVVNATMSIAVAQVQHGNGQARWLPPLAYP